MKLIFELDTDKYRPEEKEIAMVCQLIEQITGFKPTVSTSDVSVEYMQSFYLTTFLGNLYLDELNVPRLNDEGAELSLRDRIAALIKKYQDQALDKESRIAGTKMFIETQTPDELAEFVVSLQDSVDGLSKNNTSYVEAFRQALTSKGGA